MFEWKVNQIRVDHMERVLNHMEKQGFEVQVIVPLKEHIANQPDAGTGTQVLLAGKKFVDSSLPQMHRGMPAVTPENLDVVYGRNQSDIESKSA